MKGFTKGKGKGKKFIPTTKKKGLKKSDIKKNTRSKVGITQGGKCHCGTKLPNVRNDQTPYQYCSDKCKRNDPSYKKSLDKPKLKTFRVNATTMYPDGGSDFESNHVDTIEAKDFEDAEKQVIKMFKLKAEDVSEVGADLGEDIIGYEFEHTPHDARTGEEITEKQAEKLEEEDEDLVSYTISGFELEEVKDESRSKETLDKPNSFNAKKKEVFDKIEKAGYSLKTETEEVPEEDKAEEDDPDEFTTHRFEISEEKMLSVMNGERTAEQMIDKLTNTTGDERLRFGIDSGNPLHTLMKEGKAHVDSSSGKPVWKKGKV